MVEDFEGPVGTLRLSGEAWLLFCAESARPTAVAEGPAGVIRVARGPTGAAGGVDGDFSLVKSTFEDSTSCGDGAVAEASISPCLTAEEADSGLVALFQSSQL